MSASMKAGRERMKEKRNEVDEYVSPASLICLLVYDREGAGKVLGGHGNHLDKKTRATAGRWKEKRRERQ
jgi:hypothetical protein